MTSSYLQQASQHSLIMVAMSTDRPNEALRWLKERLATISDVNTARNALHWDRQTYMPEGGVAGRAEQVATLSRLVHEMLVSRETAELIAALEKPEPGSKDFAFVRLARREYERTAKLPNRLVEELARATALAQPAWQQARARSDLEISLVEENLAVSELPAAWNAKMEEYLGVTPEDETNGVLQDVHWAAGLLGYFPTYTIGNVLAAQLFEDELKAHPEIPQEMGDGEFGTLRGWLWENIHRHGSRYDPDELIERATGRWRRPLTCAT